MLVNLTPSEETICTLLNDFCTERNAKHPEEEPVVCRIAGGWVRDKLLGIESHDIDVAINTMTGESFAQELLDAGKIESVGATIASNPEQSKHLATTRLKILGVEVDLVNLRSEKYTKESRIPTVEFGTPQEDANRRDLTINALFYNAHSREVEDFTGKGIQDLQDGLVRTPLEPVATFEDDPLRILRCVRFASRLAFEIVPGITEAAGEKSIQTTLATKISKERIGDEMVKMMHGPDPLYAMQLLHSFDLLPSILQPSFEAKEATNGPMHPIQDAVSAIASLDLLLSRRDYDKLPSLDPLILRKAIEDKSIRARLMLSAALTPFRDMTYQAKKRQLRVVESVIRDGLKLGSQNHYADGIPHLFNAAEIIIASLPSPLLTGSRLEMGTILRNPSVHNHVTGSEWSMSVLFSLVQELATCWPEGMLDESMASERIDKYNLLAAKIKDCNLDASISAAPILDGRTVCQTLTIKGGPHMTELMNAVVRWQLEHPEGDTEGCKSWLLEEKQAGRFGDLPEAQPDDPRKKRKLAKDVSAV